jgi:predicted O-methyltransferase YrrM
MSMRYTNTWFDGASRDNFVTLSHKFGGTPFRGLEIGSFEGKSSNWIVENWCTHPDALLTCVDPFTGNDEHTQDLKDGLYERFLHNTRANSHKIRVMKMPSARALLTLGEAGEKFDFVYVDGDHHNFAALTDAILADKLLKVGGHLAFDDYSPDPCDPYDHPHDAINYFLQIAGPRYEVVIRNYQLHAIKRA